MAEASLESEFQKIVSDLKRPLLSYLLRYVGDYYAAEDLLQETLSRMFKGYSSFSGRSSIKTWAFAIASRVGADYYRHPDRKRNVIELNEECDPADPDQFSEEQLITDEMNDCIREIVDSLPDTYKAALILKDFEGLSVKQIAEICECTQATAKIRIHRARQRLKEEMSKECDFYHNDEGNICCDRKAEPPSDS